MSAQPEQNPALDAAIGQSSTQAEQAELEEIYTVWTQTYGPDVDLLPIFRRVRSGGSAHKLLSATSGYLVMAIEAAEVTAPMATYRRSQQAIANLIMRLPAKIPSEELEEAIFDQITLTVNHPPVALARSEVSEERPVEESGGKAKEEVESKKITETQQTATETSSVPTPPVQTPAHLRVRRFKDIQWDEAELNRQQGLRRRSNMIKLLLRGGAQPQTLIKNPYAKNIPYEYRFPGDIVVDFLPHWDDFYRVELVKLTLPEDGRMLQRDIAAARLGREAFKRYAAHEQRAYIVTKNDW